MEQGKQPTGGEKPPAAEQKGSPQGTGLATNIASLLCYICFCFPITGVVFLFIEKNDRDVQFHAWQGTILGAAGLILLVATKIISMIFLFMPSIMSWIGAVIAFLIPVELICIFVLGIICMVKAYQGERWQIPVIGEYSARKVGI